MPAGSYVVVADAPGYVRQTASLSLAAESSSVRDFELVRKEMTITLRVSFDAGTAELKLDSNSKAALNNAARILNDNPTIVVEIQGHTDNRGSEQSNLRRSEKRAQAVVDYLVKNCGIDPARLVPKGYGSSRPIATNDVEDGRALNRRIEFVVTGEAGLK